MADELRDTPTIVRGLELLDYDPFTRLDEGTRFQQPAVFLCSIATWERERPDGEVAAGHSLGEYAALGVSRVVEIDTTGGPGFGFDLWRTVNVIRWIERFDVQFA